MNVLIVDDSVVMRKIVESALLRARLEISHVLSASNGAEAIAMLEALAARGQSVHLILCDVHMPVMDGLRFLIEKSRRNLASGVPVVMITADASDPHLLQAIAAGAHSYISKPFTIDQMQVRLAPLLPHLSGSTLPNSAPQPAQQPGVAP
jgi:two-component system chemotaxis response regulator CheY